MSIALKLPRTLDEFLAWEERQTERYEFLGPGRVRLMTGGSLRHNAVTVNIVVALTTRLRRGRCRVHSIDLKVSTPSGRALYPDVFVRCTPRAPTDTVVDDPVVAFEVLSRGTVAYDRGEKRELYRTIPSLMHHVLVSQDRAEVEVATRAADGRWGDPAPLRGPDATLRLDALGIDLPLAETYADAELGEAG
jgi:Uma2 family endonuclease